MPLFHYKTIDLAGNIVEGEMEAQNRLDVPPKLKKDGVSVIYVEEKKNKIISNFNINIPFLSGVSTHDKITFARNLGSMVEAGLTVTKALSIMEKQSKGELKKILIKISEDVSQGKTLSDGMKKHSKTFSSLFVSMVKAGEESGNLVSSLKNVSLQMEKSYLLNKKIRGAMIYPIIILSLMVVIGVLMMIYMVPTLSATFTSLGVALPLSTRIIIAISNALKDHFLLVFTPFIAFIILFTYLLKTKVGKRTSDFVAIHTPIIGEIVKEINAARTARTLSSLVLSGVDIVVALSVTEEVLQNSYYKDVIKKAQTTIQKGDLISKIFHENTNLYPLFVGEMMAVGEETGKIGGMLLNVAEFYEEEVDQKTKDMSSVVEPFLMIFIGAVVGFFAISVISPIYSLGNNI